MQITRIWHTVRLRLFPLIYRICVTCSVKHPICNRFLQWDLQVASFFFIFSSFSVSIFWQKFQVQFGALCYALDICVLKSGVKIQDACLNNTVSPAELASDVRGDGASLCFSHHTSCNTFGHVMWVVLWKKNNKQVQDVMSDLVNQCTRNTLP